MKYALINGILLDGTETMQPRPGLSILVNGDRIEAMGVDIKTYTYDGDTPGAARRAVRQAGHIVVTNPDDFLDVVSAKSGNVSAGDTLITVLKRS